MLRIAAQQTNKTTAPEATAGAAARRLPHRNKMCKAAKDMRHEVLMAAVDDSGPASENPNLRPERLAMHQRRNLQVVVRAAHEDQHHQQPQRQQDQRRKSNKNIGDGHSRAEHQAQRRRRRGNLPHEQQHQQQDVNAPELTPEETVGHENLDFNFNIKPDVGKGEFLRTPNNSNGIRNLKGKNHCIITECVPSVEKRREARKPHLTLIAAPQDNQTATRLHPKAALAAATTDGGYNADPECHDESSDDGKVVTEEKSPSRRTMFVEDVTVIEYDLSSEEREDKRQAFRAIGRRRHMKRLRPDLKCIAHDEFGEMMFASNSWRTAESSDARGDSSHFNVPPTPMSVHYASASSSAPMSSHGPNNTTFPSYMSPSSCVPGRRRAGVRVKQASDSMDPASSAASVAHAQHPHYPQIRRATNVTRSNQPLAKRNLNKRAASDVTYWDMFLATILFIKLLATVVLSASGRSTSDEPPRKVVTYS